jgi:hypothetical protein
LTKTTSFSSSFIAHYRLGTVYLDLVLTFRVCPLIFSNPTIEFSESSTNLVSQPAKAPNPTASSSIPTTRPGSTVTRVVDPSSSEKDGVTPFIIGLIAGGIIVLILFLIGVFFLFKRHKRNSPDENITEAKLLNAPMSHIPNSSGPANTISFGRNESASYDPTEPTATAVVIHSPSIRSVEKNPFEDQSEEVNSAENYNDAIAIADTFRKELSNPFVDNTTVDRNSTQRSNGSSDSDILTRQTSR